MNAVERLAGIVAGIERSLVTLQTTPQLAHSSIEDGSVNAYDALGSLTTVLGKQADGSGGVSAVNGPPPATPTAPAVTPAVGSLVVRWDGLWAGQEFTGEAYSRMEVHVAEGPASDDGGAATLRSTIESPRGGEVTVSELRRVPHAVWLVARSTSGRAGPRSRVVTAVPRYVTTTDVNFDVGQAGAGTTIYYGSDDPRGRDGANVLEGDLWLREPDNVPLRSVGGAWFEMRDPDIGRSLQEARAAALVAGGKGKVYTQPSPPAKGGPGDLWLNTDAGSRAHRWDGSAWEPVLLGNAAIQPGSLVARDVIATGSVSASLLEATLVLATRLVAGDPAGGRIELADGGLRQVLPDGRVAVELTPDGTSRFSGTITASDIASSDYIESISGYLLGGDGKAAFDYVYANKSIGASEVNTDVLTVKGVPIEELIGVQSDILGAQGFENTTLITSIDTVEQGVVELGFTAMPGRAYEINVNGGRYTTDTNGLRCQFLMRATFDGSVPVVTSRLIKDFGERSALIGVSESFDGHFLWYLPNEFTEATFVRMWFIVGRPAGDTSGKLTVDCRGARAVQLWEKDVGAALPNGIVINRNRSGGSAAPPPPAVITAPTRPRYAEFYITQSKSYYGDGSLRDTGSRIWHGQALGNPGGNGNQRGLVGFDIGYFRRIIGAGRITSAKLNLMPLSSHYGSGAYMHIGYHGFDTLPDAFPFGAVSERNYNRDVHPGNRIDIEATDIARLMLNRQASGFAIGAAPNTDPVNYCIIATDIYGNEQSNRMKLRVAWEG